MTRAAGPAAASRRRSRRALTTLAVLAIGLAGCAPATTEPALAGSAAPADPTGGAPAAALSDAAAPACPQPAPASPPSLPPAAMPRVPLTRVPVGRPGWGLAAAGGWLWTGGDGALIRVDPATAEVVDRIPLGRSGMPVVVSQWDGQLWAFVTDSSNHIASAHLLDPATGEVLRTLSLANARPHPMIVVGSASGMWYVSSEAAVLVRIDPATGQALAVTDLQPPGTPASAGWGFGEAMADGSSVWVTMPYDGTLVRVDAATDAVVARTCVAGVPAGEAKFHAFLPIGLGFGSVWVSVALANEVVRVDPGTNEVIARIALPANARQRPKYPTVADGGLWVPSGFEGYRIDADTNTVVGGLRFLGMPSSGSDGIYQIVGDGAALWTREEDLGYLVRAEPSS